MSSAVALKVNTAVAIQNKFGASIVILALAVVIVGCAVRWLATRRAQAVTVATLPAAAVYPVYHYEGFTLQR